MEENKDINEESGEVKKRTAADYEKLLSESQALRAAFLALSASDPLSDTAKKEDKSDADTAVPETIAEKTAEETSVEEKSPETVAAKEKKPGRRGRSKKAKSEEKMLPEEKIEIKEEISQETVQDEPKAEPELTVTQGKKKNKKAKAEKSDEAKTPPEQKEDVETSEEKSPAVEVPEKSMPKITAPKRKSLWPVIAKRELKSYFSGPIAYIVTALFLALSGFMFFSTFFLANRAELRDFFQTLPLLMSLFIPALTMRIFAEENKSGSFETLLTLPVTVGDVVAGKYVASLVSALVMLVPSIFYVIACCIFGNPDPGPIIGGYAGSIFLAAAFTAIGVYCSAKTKNQILALVVSLALCLTLSMMHVFLMLLPGPFVPMLTFLSATKHFDSISRGILDSRDLIYFISVTVLFIVLTVRAVKKSMKG